MNGCFETELAKIVGTTIWNEEDRLFSSYFRNSHIHWQGKVYWHDAAGKTLVHESGAYNYDCKRTLKAHMKRTLLQLEYERVRTGERPKELRYAVAKGPIEPASDPIGVARGSPEWDAAWRGLRAQLSVLGFHPIRHRQHELEEDGWLLLDSTRSRVRPWRPRGFDSHRFFHPNHPVMQLRDAVLVMRLTP